MTMLEPARTPAPTPSTRPQRAQELDVLQTRAVERFAAACREQERELALPAGSRELDLALRRRREVLAREREALVETSHRQLLRSGEGQQVAALRAVVAHHHAWFVAELTRSLEERGVQVVGATGNGATAVGIAVAEQPDVVIAQGVLEMLSGDEVAAAVREHIPHAVVITLTQALPPAVVAADALDRFVDESVPA